MSGNVLEFFIKMTDLTGRTIATATANVKKFARSVAADLGIVKKTLENGLAPEKFVRTTAVLDRFGLAMDRAGISGQEFADAYDTLEKRLNEFNKTGKDADTLVQHFKASMEDLGFSAKQVESGLAMLQQNMVKVGTSGKEATTRFSMLRVANSALRGDFAALAAELTKIIPAFRNAGVVGSQGMFIAGAAVVAVIKALGALKDLVKTVFNFGAAPKEAREVSAAMLDAKNHATQFAEAMKESRDATADLTEKLTGEINALERLTKAQNELARAQALAAANSDYERENINAHFDRLNAEAGERAASGRRDLNRKNLEDEAQRLQDEIAEAERRRDEMRNTALKLGKAARDRRGGMGRKILGLIGAPFGLGGGYLDEANTLLNGSTNAWNEADKAEDEITELRKKLEKVREKMRLAESEEKAAAIDTETRKQTEANEQYSRDLAEYEREVKEAEREWQAAVKERERAERDAAKAAKERHRERMRDAQDEANATREIAAAAQSRLEAAKDYASKAWGFYMDRDSLRAHNDDVDRNIEARKQYEKEREKITSGTYSDKFRELTRISRRDGTEAVEAQLAEWRRKKSISIDTEAAMRVAVSENEQKEAMRDLQRSAEAAEKASDYLEQIVKELQAED